jgi:hypothetical protein
MKIIKQGEKPFKYWVMENAIDAKLAQSIYSELSDIGSDPHYRSTMYKYDNVFEKKYAQDKLDLFPPMTRGWLIWTLTAPFVAQMETITGIQGLVPDPWLRGGGIHLHDSGGVLYPHCDFDLHPRLKLMRRLNYIVYFNKNYEESWEGALGLYDAETKERSVRIDPGFNVGVLFETPGSVHGFTEPWAAPNGIQRKSLACYLYTSPTEEDLKKEHHSTIFVKLPGETQEMEELRIRRAKGRVASNV